mgnify:CR=1 FL=1
METGFDFNNVQKKYLPVTLADEKQTELFLRSPNKKLMQEMQAIVGDEKNAQDFDAVCNLMAKILSHNRTGYTVTPDMLADFELDEILQFFSVYQKFVEDIYNEKN